MVRTQAGRRAMAVEGSVSQVLPVGSCQSGFASQVLSVKKRICPGHAVNPSPSSPAEEDNRQDHDEQKYEEEKDVNDQDSYSPEPGKADPADPAEIPYIQIVTGEKENQDGSGQKKPSLHGSHETGGNAFRREREADTENERIAYDRSQHVMKYINIVNIYSNILI